MTKSQNTKNEQQKDLCITSEQLTEQWKKGELKDGKYWVKLSFGGTILTAEYLEYNGVFELDDHYYEDEEISEVLAPVPTFDEWEEKLRALDAAQKAIKMEDETINRLVRSGKQCNYEKAQLKELLKEVNDYLPEFEIPMNILAKIDEALK